MYSISDSGVTVLPVGSLRQTHRVRAAQEDVVFRGNFCNRAVATQTLTITDPGGGNTEFALSVNTGGDLHFSVFGCDSGDRDRRGRSQCVRQSEGHCRSHDHASGRPARSTSRPRCGCSSIPRIPTSAAPSSTFPGKLVDMLPDPARNRYYVLRQDKNQVLVFDGTLQPADRHAAHRQYAHVDGDDVRQPLSDDRPRRFAGRYTFTI